VGFVVDKAALGPVFSAKYSTDSSIFIIIWDCYSDGFNNNGLSSTSLQKRKTMLFKFSRLQPVANPHEFEDHGLCSGFPSSRQVAHHGQKILSARHVTIGSGPRQGPIGPGGGMKQGHHSQELGCIKVKLSL
jgi:hypothetical protein